MASHTLTQPLPYPVGATVGVYLASQGQLNGAPSGSQIASAVVAGDGTLTFTGLDAQTRYLAYALSQYVAFTTAELPSGDPRVDVRLEGADATGVATASAIIANAITKAGVDGDLYFPKGTYSADDLHPLSGQRWHGPGKLQRPVVSTNNLIVCDGVSDVTIDVELIGDRPGNITGNTGSEAATGSLVNCQNGSTNIRITRWMHNNKGNAVRLYDSSDCTVQAPISDCHYGVTIGSGGTAGDPTGVCERNTVRSTMRRLGKNGVYITGRTDSGSSPNQTGGHNISGTIFRPGDTGIELGQGSHHCTVSGIVIDGDNIGSNNGILVRDGYGHSISGFTIRNFAMFANGGATYYTLGNGIFFWPMFTGNIHSCSVGNGTLDNCSRGFFAQGNNTTWLATDAATGGAGNAGQVYANCTVANVVVNGTQLGTVTGADATALNCHGFYIQSVTGWTISNCGAHKCQNDGFRVGDTNTGSSYATEITLSNCRASNNGQQVVSGQAYNGFNSNGTASATRIAFTACRAWDDQASGSKTQHAGFRWNSNATGGQAEAMHMTDCRSSGHSGTYTNGGSGANFNNCGSDVHGALGGAVVRSAGNVTIGAGDSTIVYSGTGGHTATIPSANFSGATRTVRIVNEGTAALTVAKSGGGSLLGPTSLAALAEHIYVTDGTDWL